MSRSAQLRGHGDRTTDPAPLGRIVAQYEGTLVSPIIPPVLRSGVTRSRLVYFPRSGSAIALLRISNKVSLSPFILSASESMRRCTVTRANSFLSIVLDPELPCSRQRRSSGRISEECARSVHLDRSIDRAQIDRRMRIRATFLSERSPGWSPNERKRAPGAFISRHVIIPVRSARVIIACGRERSPETARERTFPVKLVWARITRPFRKRVPVERQRHD